MTTIDTSRPADHGHDDHGHHGSYLKSRGSIWADIINWATTVDHKKIGVMYLVAVLFFFFCGGLMAILLRTDLLDPIRDTATGVTGGSSFLVFNKPESIGAAGQNYNRIMTLHGAIMVFMFIVPGIPASLGNFFLPLMIGAKDVAFPKLNLFSWYVYLFGALFALWSVGMGGVETGWTF